MVRFALAVTGVMLLLTAIATVWIASTEAPVGREFLRREDLTAIGLSPATFHMRRDILPKQVTTQEFVSELEGLPVTIRAE
ncbi:MAG: hypothetical protein HYY16_16630, partial [Planctomycetes bacterium]|nr:hypothetical protein [Planctomycetota bacterium]